MSRYLSLNFETGFAPEALVMIDELARVMDVDINQSKRISASMCGGRIDGRRKSLRNDGTWQEFTDEDRKIVVSEHRAIWNGYFPSYRAVMVAFIMWCVNHNKVSIL